MKKQIQIIINGLFVLTLHLSTIAQIDETIGQSSEIDRVKVISTHETGFTDCSGGILTAELYAVVKNLDAENSISSVSIASWIDGVYKEPVEYKFHSPLSPNRKDEAFIKLEITGSGEMSDHKVVLQIVDVDNKRDLDLSNNIGEVTVKKEHHAKITYIKMDESKDIVSLSNGNFDIVLRPTIFNEGNICIDQLGYKLIIDNQDPVIVYGKKQGDGGKNRFNDEVLILNIPLSKGMHMITLDVEMVNGIRMAEKYKSPKEKEFEILLDLGITQLYYRPFPGGPGGDWKVASSVEVTNFGNLPIDKFKIGVSAGSNYFAKEFNNALKPGEKVTVTNENVTVSANSNLELRASISSVNDTQDDVSHNNVVTRNVQTGDPVGNGPGSRPRPGTICDIIYYPAENRFLPAEPVYDCKIIDFPGASTSGHRIGQEHSNGNNSSNPLGLQRNNIGEIYAVIDTYFDEQNSLTAAEVQQAIDEYYGKVAPTPAIANVGVNELTLFPNPTNGMLTIAYASGSTNTIVTIQNMLGQTVVREEGSMGNNRHVVDLSKYDNGMYIVQIMDGKNTLIKKVTLAKNQ